jgi:hypothetical protein
MKMSDGTREMATRRGTVFAMKSGDTLEHCCIREAKHMADMAFLKEVIDSSAQLLGWAVGIGGATVAVVIGTSHIRPDRLRFRLPYLLFIPGWACISWSIYQGNQIVGGFLAAKLRPGAIEDVSSHINDLYGDQRTYLLLALVFFGGWLMLYTLMWIFLKRLRAGT